eukprot:6441272-Pyramimonas_sp.AAC.1
MDSVGARARLGAPARRATFPAPRRFLGEASTVSLRIWSLSSVHGAPAPARRIARSIAAVRPWKGTSGADTQSVRDAGLPASCLSWAQVASAVCATWR